MKLSKNLSNKLYIFNVCPNRSLPVRVILLIVGLEPLDQLGVDGKGVLAVGEGVPHLKARFDDFEMTIDDLKT